MESVLKIVNLGMCVGCGACNVCKHITLQENELGFCSPIIDETCEHCGKCLAFCIYDPDREDD